MRRALGAQPPFLLPGAQGADLDRGPFAALGTNHSRRLIAGQQLYRPAREDNTLVRLLDDDPQFGGAAEIVVIVKLKPWFHDCGELAAHGDFLPADAKRAQVAAAFQPDAAKEPVQLIKAGRGAHLQVQPVGRGVPGFDQEEKAGAAFRPAGLAPRLEAIGQVPGHAGPGVFLAAKRAGTLGCFVFHVGLGGKN